MTTRRRRSARSQRSTPKVLAYVRVSTDEQVTSHAGLDAQRAAISAEAERRGWTDVTWMGDEGYSGKTLERPAIAAALGMLAAGEADVLVVSRLDRLSRSVKHFASLTEQAREEGWRLIALDVAVDTSTATGEAFANVLSCFAQMERRLIGERTREALAARKASGVRLGRPPVLSDEVGQRIVAERRSGRSYAEIAEGLTADKVPTATGQGVWRQQGVYKVAKRLGL